MWQLVQYILTILSNRNHQKMKQRGTTIIKKNTGILHTSKKENRCTYMYMHMAVHVQDILYMIIFLGIKDVEIEVNSGFEKWTLSLHCSLV